MSTRTRLGKADWIAAGNDVLRSDGAPAVKLARLTSDLGVSTGSFYHHFGDFQSYLDALADDYGTTDREEAFAAIAQLPADERLDALIDVTDDRRMWSLDRALRVWAATNPRAQAAVTRLDHLFLAFLAEIFTALGFAEPEARIRALMAFSLGAALIDAPWPADRQRAVELLTRQ